MARGVHRIFNVINRQDKDFGMLNAGRPQNVRLGRVAVIQLTAVVADKIDFIQAAVNRGEGLVLDMRHAGDNLPETAEAGNDHRRMLVWNISKG